jgi:hypothetical protein
MLPNAADDQLQRGVEQVFVQAALERHKRMNPLFNQVLSSSPEDRRDLFITSARRLGTNERNLEKDFWVCWT